MKFHKRTRIYLRTPMGWKHWRKCSQTTALIRAIFGEQVWRTVDIGCGTGWPVTRGLIDPARYVGIDPSTAMLNALVAKHPIVAGLHPMTQAAAQEERVLRGARFDSVVSLGGSASYLSLAELQELAARGKRGAVVMHFADGKAPPTNDLDPRITEASLAAATEMTVHQVRVGRSSRRTYPHVEKGSPDCGSPGRSAAHLSKLRER